MATEGGNNEAEINAAAYLAAIVESSNDAIVGMTLSGVITSWNNAAQRVFGYEANEVLGKAVTLLIPAELSGEEEETLVRVRRGERVVHYETVRLREDGSRAQVSLTVSPLQNRSSRIMGAFKIAHDVTEQKKTGEMLAQLRLAIEAAPNGMVRGHEASLTQVITNLLENAVKFKAPERESRIRVHSERDGEWVNLWFEDNGIGIPGEAHEQLFTLFHRVHHDKAFPGTGLGLAIVRRAVERMGGTVRVESELGAGSRFCVRLQPGDQS